MLDKKRISNTVDKATMDLFYKHNQKLNSINENNSGNNRGYEQVVDRVKNIETIFDKACDCLNDNKISRVMFAIFIAQKSVAKNVLHEMYPDTNVSLVMIKDKAEFTGTGNDKKRLANPLKYIMIENFEGVVTNMNLKALPPYIFNWLSSYKSIYNEDISSKWVSFLPFADTCMLYHGYDDDQRFDIIFAMGFDVFNSLRDKMRGDDAQTLIKKNLEDIMTRKYLMIKYIKSTLWGSYDEIIKSVTKQSLIFLHISTRRAVSNLTPAERAKIANIVDSFNVDDFLDPNKVPVITEIARAIPLRNR